MKRAQLRGGRNSATQKRAEAFDGVRREKWGRVMKGKQRGGERNWIKKRECGGGAVVWGFMKM